MSVYRPTLIIPCNRKTIFGGFKCLYFRMYHNVVKNDCIRMLPNLPFTWTIRPSFHRWPRWPITRPDVHSHVQEASYSTVEGSTISECIDTVSRLASFQVFIYISYKICYTCDLFSEKGLRQESDIAAFLTCYTSLKLDRLDPFISPVIN